MAPPKKPVPPPLPTHSSGNHPAIPVSRALPPPLPKPAKHTPPPLPKHISGNHPVMPSGARPVPPPLPFLAEKQRALEAERVRLYGTKEEFLSNLPDYARTNKEIKDILAGFSHTEKSFYFNFVEKCSSFPFEKRLRLARSLAGFITKLRVLPQEKIALFFKKYSEYERTTSDPVSLGKKANELYLSLK